MTCKTLLTTLVIGLGLLLTGCPQDADEGSMEGARDMGEIELVYVEWSSEVASTNVVRVVLEDLGYDVKITPVGAAAMWQSVGTGDADGMVAAWLPSTHEHYLVQVQDDVVDLGANLDGTRIGLVVPAYVDIQTIGDIAAHVDRFDGRIIGIDPGAGLMSKTEAAIEAYGLDAVKLIEGSGATMTAALKDAVDRQEWIVVTGWTPHWKWARWDLRYLEDPRRVYGGTERIHTIVREGLQQDLPEAYAVLDAFYWTPEDMAELMAWNQQEDADPYENAKRWVEENPDKVAAWLPQGTE